MRNTYIVFKAMKTLVLASLATNLISSSYALVDSIILGQFVGPDALSAVNLTVPMTLVATIVTSLFISGPKLMLGKAFGECRTELTHRIFFTYMISAVGVSALFSLSSPLWIDWAVSTLCDNARLQPLVQDYASVTALIIPFFVYSMGLSVYTTSSGHPYLSTKFIILSTILNFVLDIFFVMILGMGMKGAAISSAIANFSASFIFVRFLISKQSVLSFSFSVSEFIPQLGENMKMSLPYFMNSLAFPILIFLVNRLVLHTLGADGMFSLSVGILFISFVMMLSACISNSLNTLGATLNGQHDYWGLHTLARRCFLLCISAGVFVFFLMTMIPQLILFLYGVTDPDVVIRISGDLRIIAWIILPLSLISISNATFMLTGHKVLSTLMIITTLISVALGMLLLPQTGNPHNLWYAMPLAGVSSITITSLAVLITKMRSKSPVSLSLLPSIESAHALLNESVEDGKVDQSYIHNILSYMQQKEQQSLSDIIALHASYCRGYIDYLIIPQEQSHKLCIKGRPRKSDRKECVNRLLDCSRMLSGIEVKEMHGLVIVDVS